MAARRAYMLRCSIGLSLFCHVKDKSDLHMLNLHCYHYEKNVSSRLQEIMQPFFFFKQIFSLSIEDQFFS